MGKRASPNERPFCVGGCFGGCWPSAFWFAASGAAVAEMRSMTDKRCSGDRWLYRADIVIVLRPASSWISLMVAPAIASQEQNVCRFECHTYPSIPASVRHGTNHERVSNREPSRGKTGSPDF